MTGGAGYIGAHVVRALQAAGDDVVVVDDLSTGFRDRVDVPFVRLDLADAGAPDALAAVFAEYAVDTVVHLAALKDVGESVAEPERYYRVNVLGVVHVLDAMRRAGVPDLVFSSSAAVYGEVDRDGVDEQQPCAPINPYGRTKLVGEWAIEDATRAWGLRAVRLRYFNVAGAGDVTLRDRIAANLIPIVVEQVRRGAAPRIFGGDHPTADGTCVRDYVHVEDLAEAHVAAVGALRSGRTAGAAVNIGTGSGASVRDVVDVVGAVTGRPVRPVVDAPRAGDPAAMVADPGLAHRLMGWRARRDLIDIVRSAVD
ncbi:UDP-glucose 4-epimerase GalE [Curtobacterium sp. MCBD17_023]|nr:UDP-glucose 4-epimerase GalE [Curtobacterium sp. MCBD17_023]